MCICLGPWIFLSILHFTPVAPLLHAIFLTLLLHFDPTFDTRLWPVVGSVVNYQVG